MRCFNCGGEIPDGITKCPYCNISIKQAQSLKSECDKVLEKRYRDIDKYFNLGNVVEIGTQTLKNYFNEIFNKLSELSKNNVNNSVLIKLQDKLNEIEEELQERLPIRENALKTIQIKKGEDIVECLLNLIDPPEVYSAAYNIRAKIERTLLDVYKFEQKSFYNPNGPQNIRFAKNYIEMFTEITKDNNLSNTLVKKRKILNYFVHQSKANDENIQRKFATITEQKNFLLEFNNLCKINKIICL